MHTIIFANGDLSTLSTPLPPHDLLIAADGGARNAATHGIRPDVIIGDFDSLTVAERTAFADAGARLIRHPADKDETDLELALDFAVAQGAETITLYALFGGRWDMTFANLLLLASPKFHSVRLEIAAPPSRMHILRTGESIDITGTPGDTVSVIPLGGPVSGLTYRGLAWPLENASLPYGTPRGVSNSMKESQATVALREGTLLVIHTPAT